MRESGGSTGEPRRPRPVQGRGAHRGPYNQPVFRLRFRHDFPELLTLDALDDVLASAATAPVLIYKHSLTCGTSAVALEQLTQLAASAIAAPIHLVPVQKARAVSNAIAERLALRHESPQLILIDRGVVRWHASHFGVTAGKARAALAALDVAAPGG